MFDKLENYLNQWLSEERRGVILDALDAMELYNFPNAWSEISALLEYATDEPLDMILDAIETIIQSGLNTLFGMHALVIQGGIDVKTRVLVGLKTLQNYDDPQTILAMTSDLSDPIQSFCDLLGLVTDRSWADYVDYVTDVSPTLLQRIGALYSAQEEMDVEDDGFPAPEPRKSVLVKEFLTKYPGALASVAIKDECRPIGVPLAILLNDAKLPLVLLEPNAPDQAALEIAGLVLISDTPINDYVKVAKDQLEVVFSDINFITKADVALGNYLTEISQYG